jgi:hypothetical protein
MDFASENQMAFGGNIGFLNVFFLALTGSWEWHAEPYRTICFLWHVNFTVFNERVIFVNKIWRM